MLENISLDGRDERFVQFALLSKKELKKDFYSTNRERKASTGREKEICGGDQLMIQLGNTKCRNDPTEER